MSLLFSFPSFSSQCVGFQALPGAHGTASERRGGALTSTSADLSADVQSVLAHSPPCCCSITVISLAQASSYLAPFLRLCRARASLLMQVLTPLAVHPQLNLHLQGKLCASIASAQP